jgi:hypothetical protein
MWTLAARYNSSRGGRVCNNNCILILLLTVALLLPVNVNTAAIRFVDSNSTTGIIGRTMNPALSKLSKAVLDECQLIHMVSEVDSCASISYSYNVVGYFFDIDCEN